MIRVYDAAGNLNETPQHKGGELKEHVEPLSRDFFEYNAEHRVVDFRRPTVRFCKCADFFAHALHFLLFSRPTRFKLTLDNQAVFPLLDALSNELGELVLRVKSARSFVKHAGGAAPAGRLLHSSSWVSNNKSLTLRRRSSRRARHRGGVVRHPPRQGLLPSDAPRRATKRDSAAACGRSIFLRSVREH